MIILDTQVLRGMSLDSAGARLLRVIKESRTDNVALPWMAFEERLAQYVSEYEEAHGKVLSAHQELARKLPSSEGVSDPVLTDPALVRDLWDARLRELVDVIPTDATILAEALQREANQRPPAGTKKGIKTGARDVAIWLTAIEYAHGHPEETVYFISGNTSDFTDGKTVYPAPMDTDRERAGPNFFHLTALSDLLEQLAPAVDVKSEEVEQRLRDRSGYVRTEVHRAWGSGGAALSFPIPALWQTTGQVEEVQFVLLRTLLVTASKLLEVEDIKAYRLGEVTWCTAKVTWQVIGAAMKDGVMGLACSTWTSSVMLTLEEEGPAPRIFDARRPEAPATGENIDWSSVPELKSGERSALAPEDLLAVVLLSSCRNEDKLSSWLPYNRKDLSRPWFWGGQRAGAGSIEGLGTIGSLNWDAPEETQED
ncbi:DUF4935 domain-containing protein [Streptomyces sp. MBT56]|uniref:PIN domain-containing protein n=1 Tax=unclassified Streptomyces TaxID=2593676 RepID=UPI001909BBED|nr:MULTISPECIES: PIN domain-containing protein [unclassified Streptomyces]MBK3557201.1 DUF4935 domain-containing protein [Streptomyces sp. MBT56]MBK3600362.1 DUF4935 domain-containing protein [Streptomyces sp. MBT54]MBK3617881.1 DUF4935 domain-containing protein [Streptomyces sp. MBT98]